MSKGPLSRFDAFAKTVKEAQVRTPFGGAFSLLALVSTIFLLLCEFHDYKKFVVCNQLILDQERVLSLDVLDVSGDFQQNVEDKIHKTRLSLSGEAIETSALELSGPEKPLPESYCGSCYGSKDDSDCCNSCESVISAYKVKGWSIKDYDSFEQCKRERYQENLNSQRNEGCNVAGNLQVNKVTGNFHFAPGKSILGHDSSRGHMHDLEEYLKHSNVHSMSHEIHHLSFGPEIDGTIDPLNDFRRKYDSAFIHCDYFVKCVSRTSIQRTGKETDSHSYSVSFHERDLNELYEDKEGSEQKHVNLIRSIPGVFFQYDISPLRIIERETRKRTFGEFIGACGTIIGGVVTFFAILDRSVLVVANHLKKE